MKSVYKDKYVEIFTDLERSLIFDVWAEESINMKEDEFSNFIDIWSHRIEVDELKYALTDTRHFGMVLVPDLQEKVKEKMHRVVQISLTKQAMVTPAIDDLFVQVSLDQTIEEMQEGAGFLLTKSFPSMEEAQAWLFEEGY